MKGCLAPSEIPNISPTDASHFGGLAEDLIASEFRSRRGFAAFDIYIDDYNPASYLYFLARHNPAFNQSIQTQFYTQVYRDREYRRPDMLIHTMAEQAFYEIKPDSNTGRIDGAAKVTILIDTYRRYRLPYRPGIGYGTVDIPVAALGSLIKVNLNARQISAGLIVYKICLDSAKELDVATLALLLRYIIVQLNKQRKSKSFKPVDLEPAFAREGQLAALAKTLGITIAAAGGVIAWKYFWKAVAIRFAARGTAAAALSVADGPLPVGELIAMGLAVWTVIDIIRLNDVLWADAARLSKVA